MTNKKKLKWLKAVLGLSLMAVVITGCKSSYVDNKKENPLETTSGQANVDENGTTDAEDDTNEDGTTVTQDDEDRKGFLVSTGMNVMYKVGVDGKFVSVRKELLELNEDVNVFGVSMRCSPDKVSGWNEFPARIYVIDNGEIVPFSIDGSEYKLFHEIMCTANKDKSMEISFERLELNSEAGQLSILALFNPKELPELDFFTFTAARGYDFYYSNPKYFGECVSDIEQASGEYIDIPQEYIENARVADVGPDEIYAENYAIRNVHYPNDLEVNNMNELYLYMNTGEGVLGCGVVGLICDGELLQFDDGNYFKQFNSYNGEKTFRYNLAEFEEIEDGLHYFQIVYMPFKDMENRDVEISQRFRVNLRGDK